MDWQPKIITDDMQTKEKLLRERGKDGETKLSQAEISSP